MFMMIRLIVLIVIIGMVNSASPTFREMTDAAAWPSRAAGGLEYVKKQTTFRCYNDVTGSTKSVTLNSYFLLYGGAARDGSGTNDVWAGRPNGIDWCFASGMTSERVPHPLYGDSSFEPSLDAAHCQDSNYRQYRVGGHFEGVIRSDVWTSADGITWRQVTDDAAFDPRYFASLVADSQNYLILSGGILEYRQVSDETWISRDQGRSWSRLSSPNARPDARGAAILLSSRMIWNTQPVLLWLTGFTSDVPSENKYAMMQDVWSSRNGRDWHVVTLTASFGRRDDSNAVITNSGAIVLTGGYNSKTLELFNDVWVSLNGGYSFQLCVANAEWDGRRYTHTVLDDEGYLWVMGGSHDELGYQNDVWKSVISYNDTVAVSHQCSAVAPLCGTGLTCYPDDADTFVSTDGRHAYCNACPSSSNPFNTPCNSTSNGNVYPIDTSLSWSAITTITLSVVVFILLVVIGILFKYRRQSDQPNFQDYNSYNAPMLNSLLQQPSHEMSHM